eukprot:TRINITY_DN3300_c0_g1_i4.p1 TRINITY_DN3300_c0_g1~~TRINITY_DN3300_c0_g1_i4.p1  ORF type:complete len:313 (+),score=64.21 TRINITY_DN3300_c0_g1_i4:86-1024(+)
MHYQSSPITNQFQVPQVVGRQQQANGNNNNGHPVALPQQQVAPKVKPEKCFGPATDCYVAVLNGGESLKGFKSKVGGSCKVIERFLHKSRVYFTGDVNPQAMHRYSIKRRAAFKPEIRRSRVLILSIKDKRTLTLDEAREIVQMSDLRYSMDRIDLIAVNPKTKKRNDKGYNGMVHAYVQFLTEEDADRHVNSIDAMYYKGYYVHSPQCDEHEVFYPTEGPGSTSDIYVWRNEQSRNSPVETAIATPRLGMSPSANSLHTAYSQVQATTTPRSQEGSDEADSLCESMATLSEEAVDDLATSYDLSMMLSFYD